MRLFVAILAVVFFPFGASAQAVDTVVEAATVYVSARSVDRQVIPAQTLAGDELRRLSTVSVADAIRYFSGVQVKDYGGVGGLKTVNIRSMGTHHVGVFYDGVQIGNAQNGQVDLGRFSMDNMEMIALYNGQRSHILQSAKDFSSAGAVYLTSRMPRFDEGRRDNLRMNVRAGSFGTANASGLWERRLGERLDAQLSAEYLYTTGRYRFHESVQGSYDVVETRRNGDVSALRVEGGLFGRMKSGGWKVKLYLYDSERGYPGASVDNPGRYRNVSRQWDTDLFLQSSLRMAVGGRCNLLLNAKVADSRLHYLADPTDEDAGMYIDNTFRQREAYLSAAAETSIMPRWRASLSADAQYNTLDANLESFVHPGRLMLFAAAATSVDLRRVKAVASMLHTRSDDRTRTGTPYKNSRQWTPTIALTWKPLPDKGLTIRAFRKNVFRMPTFNDLYYTTIHSADLRPETVEQYDLGAVWELDFSTGTVRRVEAQADAYHNMVGNKIVSKPQGDPFRWQTFNIGRVRIRGVNFSVQGTAHAESVETRLRVVYTWEKAQDITDPASEYYGHLIPYAPLHSGSVIATVLWRDWGLNYSFIYTGRRWDSSANIAPNSVKPWYTSDLSLTRTLGRWRLALDVNNIFDQQYDVVLNYPMPGTNFFVKAGLEL